MNFLGHVHFLKCINIIRKGTWGLPWGVQGLSLQDVNALDPGCNPWSGKQIPCAATQDSTCCKKDQRFQVPQLRLNPAKINK